MVAVDTPAVDRTTEAEKLNIPVELGEDEINLLIGCWIGKIHQGLQTEEEKENKEAANKEQQPLDDSTV